MTSTRRGALGGALAVGLSSARPAWSGGVDPVKSVDAAVQRASALGFSGQVHLETAGKVVLSKAYGRIGPGDAPPVTRRTRINIASVSKSITATVVFCLIDTGRLALTDRIDRFLPDAPADKAGITLAQLMEHSSGLPNSYAADGIARRDQAMTAILAEPLAAAPGDGSLYSNLNYEVLAAIAEIASGETYADLTRHEVLAPAGMVDTRLWAELDPRSSPDIARIAPTDPEAAFDVAALGPNWGYTGSGGVWSTADDIAAFVRAVMAGRIIRPASVEAMLAPRTGTRGPSAFTYGWFVRGGRRPMIWTRGVEDWGHNAVAYWWPDARTLLTLTSNAGQHEGLAWSRWLGESLEPVLFDRPGAA
ncbi:MAG TPA: serine hydrolase domain-containing protein [Caulobacter sp.]|nr:serine hydrolase domain-containing protein [Caulobacter sp.]